MRPLMVVGHVEIAPIRSPQDQEERLKRPSRLLQPLPLVIQDCSFAARSLASVIPTVRRGRGLAATVSTSLIISSAFCFVTGVGRFSAGLRDGRKRSIRLFFIWLVLPG